MTAQPFLNSYLKCVIDETLRCSQLVTFAARYDEQDSTLAGYHVPAKVSKTVQYDIDGLAQECGFIYYICIIRAIHINVHFRKYQGISSSRVHIC